MAGLGAQDWPWFFHPRTWGLHWECLWEPPRNCRVRSDCTPHCEGPGTSPRLTLCEVTHRLTAPQSPWPPWLGPLDPPSPWPALHCRAQRLLPLCIGGQSGLVGTLGPGDSSHSPNGAGGQGHSCIPDPPSLWLPNTPWVLSPHKLLGTASMSPCGSADGISLCTFEG